MGYTPSGFGSGGGVVGHIVKDPSGNAMDQKTYLKFIRGSGTQVVVTNGADLTTVEVPDQLTAPNDDLAPWETVLHSNWGDGNPHLFLSGSLLSSVTADSLNATSFSTTTGRLMKFAYRKAITVRHIFIQCASNFTNLVTFAIYNVATGERVWTATFSGTGGAFTDIACNFTLAKNTAYWFGMAVTSTPNQVVLFGIRSPFCAAFQTLSVVPAQLKNAGVEFAQMSGLTSGTWPATAGTIGDAPWAVASSGAALMFGSMPASGATLPVVFFSSVV